MDLKITLQGMDDTRKQLGKIEAGTRRMQEHVGRVFSRVPYAWGMEYGRHQRSGKLARRNGGTFYLTRAAKEVELGGEADVAEGLKKVTAPGPWVLKRLGLWIRRKARLNAPKGTLRARLLKDPKGKRKRRRRLRQTIHAGVRKRGT